MSTRALVVDALNNGTPVMVADVCELIGITARTLGGQGFTLDHADDIQHDNVERDTIIECIASYNLWSVVAEHLDLEA